MTINYFPAIYPDELLYSVLARYQKHLGEPSQTQTNVELLGNRLSNVSFDMQSGMKHLSTLMPNLSSDQILDEMTLFNYLIAYAEPKLARKVRSAVLDGFVRDWYITLGYAAFKVERVTVLRFCIQCNEKMLKEFGELYWKRSHQLPSVFICLEHQISLSKSLVDISKTGRHSFIYADKNNCLTKAENLIPSFAQNKTSLVLLNDLAKMSLILLNPNFKRKTLSFWTTHYRRIVEELGLIKSKGNINLQEFKAGMTTYYNGCLDWLPGLNHDVALPWVGKLLRKQRSQSHPLQHILLQCYLNNLQSKLNTPFGNGPWECRNPLSNHYGKKFIKSYKTHANHGNEVAVFECKCGYIYTRWFNQTTGETGLPRFYSYGPLLKQAIEFAVNRNDSLREISRCLQIDPKTVVRQAIILGIDMKWKSSFKPRHTSNEELTFNTPELKAVLKRVITTKLNWIKIDVEIKKQLVKSVRQIRRENPPVRITIIELERRFKKGGWISKRLKKLPISHAYLNNVVESQQDFRKRKISRVIAELESNNELISTSNVIRKSGFRTDAMPLVEAALSNYLDIRN